MGFFRGQRNIMRIMLVEDSDVFRGAFKEELLALCPAATVREAASGEEAMRELKDSAPQIIFMDLRLPGENGLRLTQRIKAEFPNIRIAMLTSYDLPEYREAANRSGAERYFVKDSFSWNEVEEFIQCP